ncbi:MAG: DUF4412 domain-containing protein [Bacteroidota bacterium]
MNHFPFSSTLKLFLSLILLILFALPTQAQIPGRVKRRVNQRIEDRILKKVDEAVDKVLDEVEEEIEESQEENAESGEGGTEVEVDNNNTVTFEKDNSPYVPTANEFIGTFKMKFESTKKGKSEGASIATYVFDEWQTGIIIESGEKEVDGTVMIFNHQKNTITTKMDQNGSPTAMIIKRPRFKTTVESEHAEEDVTITPTNEYETIAGYRCRKYLIETPKETGEAWLTTDLDIDYMNLMAGMGVGATQRKGGVSTPSSNTYGIEGFPMRSRVVDGDQVITTEVEFIKPNQVDKKVFDLSGYQVTDLSSFQRN